MAKTEVKPINESSLRKKRSLSPPSSFRLVEKNPILFTSSKRSSIYYEALKSLARAQAMGEDLMLEFDRPQAKGAIASQAHKYGIKVLFAESEGKLYVSVVSANSPEQVLLDYLHSQGPKELSEIVTHFATLGLEEVNPAEICRHLSENHKIQLETILGGKKWRALLISPDSHDQKN